MQSIVLNIHLAFLDLTFLRVKIILEEVQVMERIQKIDQIAEFDRLKEIYSAGIVKDLKNKIEAMDKEIRNSK